MLAAAGRNVERVLRLLVTPRWLGRHVMLVLAVAGLILLGRWQWQRGTAYHDLRNLLYGVQWWIFAGLACYGWWRTLRLEAAAPPGQPPARPAAPLVQGVTTARVAPEDEPEDPELAAYNRYLAQLDARARRAERPRR